MSSQCVVAVDLGGTNLRVGVVCENGNVEYSETQDAGARSGSRAVLDRVFQTVQKIAERFDGRIRGVALGFPGIVDPEKGIVYQSPHFPDWKDLDLKSYFASKLVWPFIIDNDANLAARGEAWKGAGREMKNFVMLTLGTGVGGGIVINKELFHGDRGFAGEVGHICIDLQGPRCACGSRGCWEAFVSSLGILRLVELSDDVGGREELLLRLGKPLERLAVKELYELALDGNIFANVIFKKMGAYFGAGIASLANTLGIENFIVGGGVSEAWDFFIGAAKKECAEKTYKETAKRLNIQKAQLGNDAALVGGASVYFK